MSDNNKGAESFSQKSGKAGPAKSARTPHEMMTNAKFQPNVEAQHETTPEMYFLNTKKYSMYIGGTKTKGFNYNYTLSKDCEENMELQEMLVIQHAEKFMAETSMHKLPIIRFPVYTRRIMGVSLK